MNTPPSVSRAPFLQLFVVLASCAVFAGCAALSPEIEAPIITIADVGVGSIGLFEQQINLKLRIQNPNDRDLKVDGIAFDFEVNDQLFAQGVGNRAVIVPRYGFEFMTVGAVSTLSAVIKQFSALARAEHPGFRYRIKGTLSLQGSRIPFDRSGGFDLGGSVPKQRQTRDRGPTIIVPYMPTAETDLRGFEPPKI